MLPDATHQQLCSGGAVTSINGMGEDRSLACGSILVNARAGLHAQVCLTRETRLPFLHPPAPPQNTVSFTVTTVPIGW